MSTSPTTIRFYCGDGFIHNFLTGAKTPYDAKLTPDDIREIQIIDADCNDCTHFKRGAMIKAPGLKVFDGHCLKFDKPTRAYPMQYTGHECFQHRRPQPL